MSGLVGVPQFDWQPTPQKSGVVPQKPYCEQQTLSGHVADPDAEYCPQGAWASQLDVQPVPQADEIIVHKAERRLYLMRHGEVLREYKVALGLEPEGAKERAGDFRTPEGRYQLQHRNARSDYFLSIQVSYPNEDDKRRAHHNGWDPGGSIMIHGMPNNLHHPLNYYWHQDWTDGCIALSNSDMVELWLMTPDNIPIDIMP